MILFSNAICSKVKLELEIVRAVSFVVYVVGSREDGVWRDESRAASVDILLLIEESECSY